MASKVCGKRSGVAKRATVIPVVLDVTPNGDFTIDSVYNAVQLVLADIPARRSRESPESPSALAGKTVMMMAVNIDIGKEDEKYVELLAQGLQAIMDLGVIVAVPAGNYNGEHGEGFVAATYPAALAVSRLPTLIRVGVVDQTGRLPTWAQQGDVYACGVGVLCAKPSSFSFLENGEGSCASLATFAGLVAYNMGRSSVPYKFGDDIKQYQNIVKQYHVSGEGSWVRPNAKVRTVWNGEDGSASTYCPLSLRKRDAEINDTCAQPSSTSSAAAAAYSPVQAAIVIYYSHLTDCSRNCAQTYYIYNYLGEIMPSVCPPALFQLAQSPSSDENIDFQMFGRSGAIDFTYSRANDEVGEVTGASLSTPVVCSAAPSPTPSKLCNMDKRSVFPDGPEPVIDTYYEWATCIWSMS